MESTKSSGTVEIVEQQSKISSGFSDDLELLENADLIYWYEEMVKNNMVGAVEDIKGEMVRRFLLTNWSAVEDVIRETEGGIET